MKPIQSRIQELEQKQAIFEKQLKVYEQELAELIKENQQKDLIIEKLSLEIENIYEQMEKTILDKIKDLTKKIKSEVLLWTNFKQN